VAASILEASTKILGFSVRSRNLKGTYVKLLRDASAAITAGPSTLEKRMAMGPGGEEMDLLDELREENRQLKASQEQMRKELEELRE
ncbi:hypothetical protein EAI_04122, partial [Harpegnathos saltator]